jgi:hypothetical protein
MIARCSRGDTGMDERHRLAIPSKLPELSIHEQQSVGRHPGIQQLAASRSKWQSMKRLPAR